jgi:hypothetical protein
MIKHCILIKNSWVQNDSHDILGKRQIYDEYSVNSTWTWGFSSLSYLGYNKSNFLVKYVLYKDHTWSSLIPKRIQKFLKFYLNYCFFLDVPGAWHPRAWTYFPTPILYNFYTGEICLVTFTALTNTLHFNGSLQG